MQQGGCVDSRQCGTFDQNLKKINSYLFPNFLVLPSVAYDPESWQKVDQSHNSTKLYSTDLFIYYTNIQNVSSIWLWWLYNRHHNHLYIYVFIRNNEIMKRNNENKNKRKTQIRQ